jgi:L-tartrate/succinate antiporter
MWVAIATTCVTSSMFLTGLAPNLLAIEMVSKTAKVSLTWTQWFVAFLPIGIVLLALIPLVTYWLYPPEVKSGDAVPKWAGEELAKLGGLTNREITLGVLVLLALGMWISAATTSTPPPRPLVVISLMLVLGVVSWDDIVKNSAAWNTLAWFATLVALADGLNRVGFVKWFANTIGAQMGGFSPFGAMILLVLVFYLTHYLFASDYRARHGNAAGHAGGGHDGSRHQRAGVRAAACASRSDHGRADAVRDRSEPVYYGSGYLPSRDYWRLGAIFGALFIAVMLIIAVPWLALIL